MAKKSKEPITESAIHVTNRNRKLLEKKHGIDIPKDVEWVLVGDAFEDYLQSDINTVREKSPEEKDYEGIDFID